MLGSSGKVLEWFVSYLKECSQRVSVQGVLSNVLCLLCSILGPLIFIIYTEPLGTTAKQFGVGYHMSHDVGSEPKFPSSLKNLKHCFVDISHVSLPVVQ